MADDLACARPVASITVIVSWPLLATNTRRPFGRDDDVPRLGAGDDRAAGVRSRRRAEPLRGSRSVIRITVTVPRRGVGDVRVAVVRVERDALRLVADLDRRQHPVGPRVDHRDVVGAGVDDPDEPPVARQRDRARVGGAREAPRLGAWPRTPEQEQQHRDAEQPVGEPSTSDSCASAPWAGEPGGDSFIGAVEVKPRAGRTDQARRRSRASRAADAAVTARRAPPRTATARSARRRRRSAPRARSRSRAARRAPGTRPAGGPAGSARRGGAASRRAPRRARPRAARAACSNTASPRRMIRRSAAVSGATTVQKSRRCSNAGRPRWSPRPRSSATRRPGCGSLEGK